MNVIKYKPGVGNLDSHIKRGNFLIAIDSSIEYGPTDSTDYWNSIVPSTNGYVVYIKRC
jgi:hypothetical protein